MKPLRSILFAPGNQPRKCEKALASEADMICLDLEDAVPRAEKSSARAQVVSIVSANPTRSPFVRVNGMQTEHCFPDLSAVVGSGIGGIILPRFESEAQLATVDWVLAALERAAELPQGSIEVLPVVETAVGVSGLVGLRQLPPRVKRLSFGAWDYTLDTGIAYAPDEAQLAHARAAVVMQSRTANLAPPIDTSWPFIGDVPGLERSCKLAVAMGYGGKACIHPEQVEPVNRLFSPAPHELAEAKAIVEAFEKALAAGTAAIKVNDRFVDYPIYEKSRRFLQRHGGI